MSKKEAIGLLLEKDENPVICEFCSEAKLTTLPFERLSQRNSQLLESYANIWTDGGMNQRKSKVCPNIHNYSRWTEVSFIQKKSKVL